MAQMVIKLPYRYKVKRPHATKYQLFTDLKQGREQCTQKSPQPLMATGFFDVLTLRTEARSQRINAWRTEDAYALYADRLSYVQLHERHG
ncbi:hypothetical protein CLV83_4077 [Marinobacterium mangrovicola]|uniref:Uncharacterized protein n=1 Tax=Marinobacterium mangrovicola TaxID=1476959 RepID=A0A4R1G8L3_9GAMM|nr:hypothetical protein CLV83_4077 [Marinobacterium mangrovicola]